MRFFPSAVRSLRPYHQAVIVFIALGWTVTIIGGYALRWNWTGYEGNTLWDWLQLLLLPLVVPTILLPIALKWVSGNAAQRAQEAREAARNSPSPSRPPAYEALSTWLSCLRAAIHPQSGPVLASGGWDAGSDGDDAFHERQPRNSLVPQRLLHGNFAYLTARDSMAEPFFFQRDTR